MSIAKEITRLRESVGENRRQFSDHTGIPVRTLEDWEAGRRTPPEYLPRLIAYQLAYEKLAGGQGEVAEPSTVVVEDPTPTPAPGSESSDANMEVYLLWSLVHHAPIKCTFCLPEFPVTALLSIDDALDQDQGDKDGRKDQKDGSDRSCYVGSVIYNNNAPSG